MSEFYAVFQCHLQTICLWALLAISGMFVFMLICKGCAHAKKYLFVFLPVLIGCWLFGGSKSPINNRNTSTDENIELLDIELTISNEVVEVSGVVQTNFVQAVLNISVSDNSVVPQPIWFRESNYQTWTNITALASWTTPQPVLNPSLTTPGTNVYTWISRDWTNNYSHAQWYIGTELPAVQVDVDVDYIILDEFNMTSKKVWIKFHLVDEFEYPEGTTIEVQRKIENGKWEVVDEMAAVRNGVYTWHGFAVGARTVWRLHMAITKTGDDQ